MEKKTLLFVFFLSVFMQMTAQTTRLYVKQSGGSDANSGLSWSAPLASLDTALERVSADKNIQYEIWVAKGIYKPTKKAGDGKLERDKAFVIPENVSLYGGFAGTENNLEERNIEKNETVLSGDIGVPDNTFDNCYHVVIMISRIPESVFILDGFTIKDGRYDSNNSITVNGASISSAHFNTAIVASASLVDMTNAEVAGSIIIANNTIDGGIILSADGRTSWGNSTVVSFSNAGVITISNNKIKGVLYAFTGTVSGSYFSNKGDAGIVTILNNIVEGDVFASADTYTSSFADTPVIGNGGLVVVKDNQISGQLSADVSASALEFYAESYRVGHAGKVIIGNNTIGSASVGISTNVEARKEAYGGNAGNADIYNNIIDGALYIYAWALSYTLRNNDTSTSETGDGGIVNITSNLINRLVVYASSGAYTKSGRGGIVNIVNNTIAQKETSNNLRGAGIPDSGNRLIVNADAKEKGKIQIYNTIIWGPDNKSIDIDPSWNQEIIISNCLVKGKSALELNNFGGERSGNGNINSINLREDEIFAINPGKRYSLCKNSPAYNTGNSSLYDVELFGKKDLNGKLRIQGKSIDIGAYEFEDYDPDQWMGNLEPKVEFVKVYPNPVSDLLTIESLRGKIRQVDVLNLSGNNVIRVKPDNNMLTLDVCSLPQGTYIVHVRSDFGVSKTKIIKK